MPRILFFMVLSFMFLPAQELPAVTPVGPPVPLTPEGLSCMAPRWSPAGDLIAFTGTGYHGIQVLSLAHNRITTLSDDPAAGYGMEWSPDGRFIAARIARPENLRRTHAVAVFDPHSGDRKVISDFVNRLPGIPRWTGDQAFVYLDGSDRFRLFPVESGRPDRPNLDLDIIYTRNDRLQVRNPASKQERTLNGPPGKIMNLAVSPPGTKLVFEVYGGHLWSADSHGGNLKDLGSGYNPRWHPDGNRIVYMITLDDGHRFTSSDIYVINADGSGKTSLTASRDILEMHPDWSPDGRWIVYDTYESGQIFIQEVAE